jgi:hypothetical protein
MKFDRRIVVRNSLTDLESAVIALEAEGWVLDPTVPDKNSGTILGALRALRGPSPTNIPVPMRRQIHEPAAAMKKVIEIKPVNDPDHPEIIMEASIKHVPK